MCLKNDFVENSAFNQEIDALLSDEYKDYCNVFHWKNWWASALLSIWSLNWANWWEDSPTKQNLPIVRL